MIWRRYTLLCVLVITALPLMIMGWAGRNSLYSQYELAPLKEPGLALVMRGIHDGVYPWQNFLKTAAICRWNPQTVSHSSESIVPTR
jgi:hypothetical protein